MSGWRDYNFGDARVRIAVSAIFRTEDGKVLKSLLQSVIEQVASPTIAPCALHDMNGRRTLARNLIDLAIEDHAVDDPDTPAKPVARSSDDSGESASRRRGPARFLADARPGRHP